MCMMIFTVGACGWGLRLEERLGVRVAPRLEAAGWGATLKTNGRRLTQNFLGLYPIILNIIKLRAQPLRGCHKLITLTQIFSATWLNDSTLFQTFYPPMLFNQFALSELWNFHIAHCLCQISIDFVLNVMVRGNGENGVRAYHGKKPPCCRDPIPRKNIIYSSPLVALIDHHLTASPFAMRGQIVHLFCFWDRHKTTNSCVAPWYILAV